MPPETEVVSCPACDHLLRVPLDWLGQPVQCPECRATFRAPVRAPDGLTAPELISRPAAAPGAARRRPPDVMLLLPAFGLLFVGVAGLAVNGLLTYRVLTDPAGVRESLRGQLPGLRQYGFGADDPPAGRDELDGERAARIVGALRWVLPAAGVLSAVTFLGGLSVALRWNSRLAQAGCVAAVLNLPHLCCVPGAVAGVWGLLMLRSDEGRAHFAT